MRFLSFFALASLSIAATAAELRQPLPSTWALVDVRIVTAPGESLDNATLVVRDGLIEAVGVDIEPPPDATVIEFERAEDQPPVTIYPGLIDPYLVVDTEPERGGDETPDTPAGRHPLIRPDLEIDAALWPGDAVEKLRQAGFTSALIAPGYGLFRGQSVLANLGDGGLASNRLAGPVAQHANLHGSAPSRQYPQSLMGSIALVRQTLSDARWQASAQQAWQRNPAQPRPQWLEGLDALQAALAGEQPLVVESTDALDTLRVLELFDTELHLVIVGHGREYQRLEAISARAVPHILPLNFPDEPDVDEDNLRDVALEELRHWHAAPDNPARLVEAGVPVLLTAHGQSSPADLFGKLKTAIERGLDRDQALAALTTAPAEWLGIGDRAGRLAPGYMANLVIVEGELFTDKPTFTEVWIDGRRHRLTALDPPTIEPAGTWALTLGLPDMGDVEGELVLAGAATDLSGTLTVMGTETPLSDIDVSGNEVTVRIDASRFGGSGTITMRLEVEGDRGRGSGSGPFGEFTVRGQRTSTPDPEAGA